MRSKHIDWIQIPLGLTLAMTLTLILKVNYAICYILVQNYLIATKKNEPIDHLASIVAISLHLGHDLELGLSRSNFLIAVLQEWQGQLMWKKKSIYIDEPTIWPWPLTTCMALTMEFTLNKRVGSWSFITMTVTFWWPRWGIKIYRIRTGVNSNVSLLLTYLVVIYFYCDLLFVLYF